VSSVGSGQMYMGQMQDAYMNQARSRLDPMWEQRESGMESKLANMGLTRGSEAWNNEMANLSRGRNDAYGGAINSAILNSGAEAQRMQGMELAGGEFANNAAQQNFQNQFQSQEAYNAALQGQQGMDLAANQFQNQAQQQGFDQQLAAANLNNQGLNSQQAAALGWQNASNSVEIARNNASASSAGAHAAAAASRYAADAQMRNSEANNAMEARRLENSERLQNFNMTRQMYYDPIITQNMLSQGMYPTGNTQMPGFTNAGNPQMPNSANYAQMMNQGNNQAAGGLGGIIGSLGGFLGGL
jgi:hypothetical protein